ncbi:TolC family protein [Symmachiella macrocystis]|uniref:TolC family protein n=1 Tax=Symmachiella macrocystis TaxID=2527985 RepID=UPI001E4EA11F|nr:TolC family protein [Symmachiella macrocystis]
MENNPDIGVAASQVTAAAAQLKRMQLNVMQQVMELREAWHTQKQLVRRGEANVQIARNQSKQVQAMYKVGQATPIALAEAERRENEAEVALIQSQAKLAEIKAKIPYVLGTQKPVAARGTVGMSMRGKGSGSKNSTVVAAMPDDVLLALNNVRVIPLKSNVRAGARESAALGRLKHALDDQTQVDVEFVSVEDLVEFLNTLHDVQIIVDATTFQKIKAENQDWKNEYTVKASNISLGAVLQLIMDLYPDLTFVVRDYGIFVTAKGQEPEGAIPLQEFWKRKTGASATRRSYTSPGPWSYGTPKAKKPNAPKQKGETRR